MSNNRLGIYSEDDAREIHKRVLGHSLPLQELGQARQHTLHNMLYYAVLTEDLAPATNPTTGYTSAECRAIRYVQPIDSTTLNMESATGDISLQRVTNRYTTFSARAGDLLLIIRNGAEWSPVNAVGSSSQKHARIVECLGNGYYSAYLSLNPTFDLPSITGTGTDTGTGSGQYDECTPCQWITGENEAGTGTAGNVGPVVCGTLQQPSRVSVPADGALIYCYDPRLLTLGINAHVIITDMGDTVVDPTTGTGTGTGTAIATIPLYMILTGNYDLVGIPDRFYTCCDGTVVLTRCNTYIVEGVFCEGVEIQCPGTGTGT
jgi:hypothetical protein